ncbi:hypothetical protein DCW30_05740 [Streptomyces alfalfae]|uniref:Uncharacterized protein n=1 Tax=Streptomyces alfalfae TaxID=1642299 RepID=A0ABN4VKU5_9ACTN|nr:hypothetical protein A7J05_23130 [Streptomyces alfalfae]AYA18592.1 hypothetical protein D3X13_22245 [Streptomyces fradiae]RXX46527.1 hypothetical protein DCW30_05740 [Streptomyces alfalfae]RZM90040.1 hypothetical protein D4104_25675 [Streptomyces alfalfae]
MIPLPPARAARLFADIEAQQRQFPSEQHLVPLPHCPVCATRPYEITHWAEGRTLTFSTCGHIFSLSREALVAGLVARRTA